MVDLSDIIDRFPPIIPRESDSTIRRFIEAFQDDTDELGESLDDIQDSRFIDNASGEDLERIGAQFGPLGNRAGRDDQEYRAYLKSLVPVFEYRGTVPGIKAAVAAGLGIDDGIGGGDADLSIYEHFNDDPANQEEYLEYTITLDEWSAHRGSTIETLAELSDSSVSRLRKIRYNVGDEDVEVNDVASILEGQQITEEILIDDGAEKFVSGSGNSVFENISVQDTLIIDGNTFGPFVDEIVIDDSINSTRGSASEEISTNDESTVESVNKNEYRWEDNSNPQTTAWDFFEWTELVDLLVEITEAESDDVGVTDGQTINANTETVEDEAGVSESLLVRFNVNRVDEFIGIQETSAIQSPTTSSETTISADSVTTSIEIFEWESRDWGDLRWAGAP